MHSEDEVRSWARSHDGKISLLEVIRQIKPTILIGSSGVHGAFSEKIIKEMAARVDRPIIMPMSNPTALAEAIPEDLIRWTQGRALIATWSPIEPVTYEGIVYEIGQSNNAFVFPGFGRARLQYRSRRSPEVCLLPLKMLWLRWWTALSREEPFYPVYTS